MSRCKVFMTILIMFGKETIFYLIITQELIQWHWYLPQEKFP